MCAHDTAYALPIRRSKHVLRHGEDVKLENAIFFHVLCSGSDDVEQ